MRILIADDNLAVRRGVQRLLSGPALEVCGEAADGEETIQKAKELLPDLILLDVSMPGMNGLEVTRRLRQEAPECKIVVMSQHDLQQLEPRAREVGAHACVDKACLGTDLLRTIQQIFPAR